MMRPVTGPTASPTTPKQVSPNSMSSGLHIYFGSQTGTAEAFARELGEEASIRGITSGVAELDDCIQEEFAAHGFVIICVSTTGDGEPPDNAQKFHDWITHQPTSASVLDRLSFAVFGLGDRGYATFNQIGEQIDANLARLGAKRFHVRGIGDDSNDIAHDFYMWQQGLWQALEATSFSLRRARGANASASAQPAAKVYFAPSALDLPEEVQCKPAGVTARSYSDLGKATVIRVEELRQECYSEEGVSTVHVELDVSGNDVFSNYCTGDTLAVLPENDVVDVEAMISLLGLEPAHLDQYITLIPAHPDDEFRKPFPTPCLLREALSRYCDLRRAPTHRKLIEMAPHLESTPQHNLDEFLRDAESVRLLQSSTWTQLDFWGAIGARKLDLGTFLLQCPRQRLRHYSIASSQTVTPGIIHLCVSLTRVPADSDEFSSSALRTHRWIGSISPKPSYSTCLFGLCSSWICMRLRPSDVVYARVQPSSFKLPKSDVPVVLVGAGSGIAPLRGFYHEILASPSRSAPVSLFFGCQHPEKDWIYKDEMLSAATGRSLDGRCLELYMAFSRAENSATCKYSKGQAEYVQEQVRTHFSVIRNCLDKQGVLFICGSTPMGKGVLGTLEELLPGGAAGLQRSKNSGQVVTELWGFPRQSGTFASSSLRCTSSLTENMPVVPRGTVVRIFAETPRQKGEGRRSATGFKRLCSSSINVGIHGPRGKGLQDLLSKTRRLDEPAVRNRAILIQPASSYTDLRQRFPELAPTLNETTGNGFGENVLVQGVNINDFCIGDIWRISNGSDPGIELQICTPRRPCAKVNKAHNAGSGFDTLQDHCLRTGLAGCFCRVLREGEINNGDILQCLQRPHPRWPIGRVASVTYGDADAKMNIRVPRARREETLKDMRELAELEELGDFEWRAPLRSFLASTDGTASVGSSSTWRTQQTGNNDVGQEAKKGRGGYEQRKLCEEGSAKAQAFSSATTQRRWRACTVPSDSRDTSSECIDQMNASSLKPHRRWRK